MANVSKIKLPDGNTYNITDTTSGYQKELVAGDNITIQSTISGPVISAAGGGGVAASVSNATLFLTSSVSDGDGVYY